MSEEKSKADSKTPIPATPGTIASIVPKKNQTSLLSSAQPKPKASGTPSPSILEAWLLSTTTSTLSTTTTPNPVLTVGSPSPETTRRIAELEAQIQCERKTTAELSEKFKLATRSSAEHANEKNAFETQIAQQYKKEQLRYLLDRVCPDAQRVLLDPDSMLLKSFQNEKSCDAFVISIDIRRSTELMLKAREPRLFAEFIRELGLKLGDIVIENLGVFDKFTGDGILAFFPEFYSGADSGFRVVETADKCHEVFRQHYRDNRRCFTAVLRDTGLGIGVDFGKVHMVQIGGALTVVGNPVVYACRMGSAPAGSTLLNQPAYEQIFDLFSAYCDIEETSLPFKHEGDMVAYTARRNKKQHSPANPEWLDASQTPPNNQRAEDSTEAPK